MKIKLSKNKKIILLISGLGILTTSIVTPIVIINNKNKDNKQSIVDSIAKQNIENLNKVNEIIAKIKNKDILIAPNVSTQNHSEIQDAIKDQLKKENQTLNEYDISKITINNIGSLTLGIQIEVTLIIRVKNKNKELKINVEKINLLKNLNVNLGNEGTIFQDSFGNLWTMARNKKLQVLKANSNGNGYAPIGWTDNTSGLLNDSNITNGRNGTIFQDSFKNLWTMGYETPLQVLKVNSGGTGYVSTGWTNDNTQGLLNGSNITNGNEGTIFQDSFKNLWAMGISEKLQVLKVNSSGEGYENTWVNDNKNTGDELLKNSNINNGNRGTIFQDSFKNLWAMGISEKLQVLKVNSSGDGYVSSGWTDDNTQGLLDGSNITNGYVGTIFQDSFKNLWTMGNGTPLQVLKVNSNGDGYVSTVWTNDSTEGLLNGSNITNGVDGKIFQDSFKNLWAIGTNKKLQVLKVNSSGEGYENIWVNDNNKITGDELLKNSNINIGSDGIIFQDSFKNLWTMGNNTKLQVLKANSGGDGYVPTGWTNDNTQGLLDGSNIIDGYGGQIFQDKFKNLWTMGYRKPLQVLIANSDNNGYLNSWL